MGAGELAGAVGDAGGAMTIADVIARMEAIDASLPRHDGVAYFNRLYLQVTRAVEKAYTTTTFEDRSFLDRLDIVFAGFYFDAEQTIVSAAPCPVAWRPLMQERSKPRSPIQFALAGMNAHINHDLPLAVVQTCEQLAIEPADDTPAHADYQRVDAILQNVEGEVASWFDTGVIADVEDVTPKQVDDALAMWSIVAARDVAWDHAQVLWQLRRQRELARAYSDVLARATELSGRAMLV